MDFKNYVRLMLENEKAKDQDEDKETSEDEEEDEDFEDDDDDEEEASVRTVDNGCEPSVRTKCYSVSSAKKCPVCGKDPCVCSSKHKSLRESIIYSAKYSSGTLNESVLSEETKVLVEGIKDNSVSKFLSKLYKRAEKEAAKYEKKGLKEKAKVAKDAAKELREASNKIYRCEVRYTEGDASAKKEYKQICKQYSNELKKMGAFAKGLKTTLFTILAGSILLGGIGVTVVSNDDIIDKLKYGFQNKERMPEILKSLEKNDKSFINSVLKGTDLVSDNADWKGKKADWEAQKTGIWKNAAEQEKFQEPYVKALNKVSDFWDGFTKPAKDIEKSAKAGKEVAEKSLQAGKEVLGKK